VVLFNLVIQGAARGAKTWVIHNAGGSAKGGGDCPGIKIITTEGNPCIYVQVGVDIHPAGNNNFARGINHFSPIEVFPNLCDFFPFAPYVADCFVFFGDD
jgi:hypothetical protein